MSDRQQPERRQYWFRLPHLTQTSQLHDTLPSNVTPGVSPVSVSMFHGHTCTCVFGQVPCPAALPASHHTTQDRGQHQALNPEKLDSRRRLTTPVRMASTLLRPDCPTPAALRTPNGITRIQSPGVGPHQGLWTSLLCPTGSRRKMVGATAEGAPPILVSMTPPHGCIRELDWRDDQQLPIMTGCCRWATSRGQRDRETRWSDTCLSILWRDPCRQRESTIGMGQLFRLGSAVENSSGRRRPASWQRSC